MDIRSTSQNKGHYSLSIDIDRILMEIDSLTPFDDQIMLQTVEGCDDPYYGIGSLLQDHEGTMQERIALVKEMEKQFVIPMFAGLVYTNSVLEELGMYRSRIMKMKPKTCYTYHVDPTSRMHIPLKTNENCFFIVEDEVIRLPANGKSYHIDTTKKHTFVNASFEERIHIVGCKGEKHAIYV